MPPLEDVTPPPSEPRVPCAEDMIPVIQNLSNTTVSLSSVSDVHMQAADSVLGRKRAAEEEAQGNQLDLTLALNYMNKDGGLQKKGKVGETSKDAEDLKGSKKDDGRRKIKKQATAGPGASGKLTRPDGGAHQEQ